ncbi:ATP-binding protein [Actinomadura syzygii]|nr:ATP-binding protein [Actinomadura syzygii]
MSAFTKGAVLMGGEGECVLQPNAEAPGRARRFLSARFAEWGLLDDDGRLIVSELVTNAVQHGDGPVAVHVFKDERDGLPVIEVRDGGLGWPVVQPENRAATSGRGLTLVACLACDWGIRPLPDGGKVTWAKCGL